jgi:hypothetical protein
MKPWAMGAPNGPAFARSGSTWIHWWSLVASAKSWIRSGDFDPVAVGDVLADQGFELG